MLTHFCDDAYQLAKMQQTYLLAVSAADVEMELKATGRKPVTER